MKIGDEILIKSITVKTKDTTYYLKPIYFTNIIKALCVEAKVTKTNFIGKVCLVNSKDLKKLKFPCDIEEPIRILINERLIDITGTGKWITENDRASIFDLMKDKATSID